MTPGTKRRFGDRAPEGSKEARAFSEMCRTAELERCTACGRTWGNHFGWGCKNAREDPECEHVWQPKPPEDSLPLVTEGARFMISTWKRDILQPPYAVRVTKRQPNGEWDEVGALTQLVATEREARDLHRRAVEELKKHPELFD